MKIGQKIFDVKNKTYIMGILNMTPDSFYDGSKNNSLDAALLHTEKMIKEGADIIDVGGESTRPGYIKISDIEETDRIISVISGIKKRFDIPVSCDTYKSAVALAALKAGADMINDIWGFRYDDKMAKIIKKHGAACVLMHNQEKAEYTDFLPEVIDGLNRSVKIALNEGIEKEKIILDPGVGFGKTAEHNLLCIANLDKFKNTGYPVLLGVSNKSVIGAVLDLPVNERINGTLVSTVIAVLSGAAFVRVHNVKENKQVIMMTEAVRECRK